MPATPEGLVEDKHPDPFPRSSLAPVLLLTESVDDTISLPDLRKRLGDALSRDVVALVDPRARRAHASRSARKSGDSSRAPTSAPIRWR
jgi:hypothetical protein